MPYLETFRRQYPEIRLHVTNRTSQETVKLLKEGKIDFGVVNLPVEDSQLNTWQGKPLHDLFIASKHYASLKDTLLTPEQLTAYPIIMLDKGSSIRKFTDDYFQSQKVQIVPEFELGSMDLLIEFARTGLGISCVTEEFAAKELASGEIFTLKLEPRIPPRHIGIVTLKDVPLSFAAKTMLALLQ
jgi:DNA-binding transcriptional LysR family regulator